MNSTRIVYRPTMMIYASMDTPCAPFGPARDGRSRGATQQKKIVRSALHIINSYTFQLNHIRQLADVCVCVCAFAYWGGSPLVCIPSAMNQIRSGAQSWEWRSIEDSRHENQEIMMKTFSRARFLLNMFIKIWYAIPRTHALHRPIHFHRAQHKKWPGTEHMASNRHLCCHHLRATSKSATQA